MSVTWSWNLWAYANFAVDAGGAVWLWSIQICLLSDLTPSHFITFHYIFPLKYTAISKKTKEQHRLHFQREHSKLLCCRDQLWHTFKTLTRLFYSAIKTVNPSHLPISLSHTGRQTQINTRASRRTHAFTHQHRKAHTQRGKGTQNDANRGVSSKETLDWERSFDLSGLVLLRG